VAFLSPLFLVGAFAAALPVLVHLVRRTRARKEVFPSLMFLRRIEQKTIRKRTIRNLLLLALRCLAILLLAIAFSRPYFPGSNPAAAGANTASRVVLLDASYSMQYGDTFERAKQAARNIVGEASPTEKVSVILFSDTYEVIVPLKAGSAEASVLIEQAKAGLGATDYLQALQAADGILKDAGGGKRRIFLVSDFQDAGWNRSAPPFKLSSGQEIIPEDVGNPAQPNVAINEVKAEPVVYAQKYDGKVSVRVSNFSDSPIVGSAVEFKLNDLTVERRQANIGPHSSQLIEFQGFNVPEGSNRATVEISGDTFPLDNRGFFTIRRDDQAPVLAIETAVRGRSESFFIHQSLLAGENNQHALTVKTTGSVNPADISEYRTVIVNDAGGITEPLASSIKDFVLKGGGLIISTGKHTDPAAVNRFFSGVLPAEVGDVVQNRGGYSLMSQVKTDHPIFNLFSRSGRLTSTRVYAHRRATPVEGASVVAALDDGSPVIVEKAAGNGKVLLLATSMDTAWNDLPLTPMYLPLIRQMLEYLGGKTSTSGYTVGQVFGASADPDGSLPAIQSPDGNRVEELKNPSGELLVTANEQGFYRLRYRDRTENVAVNLDTRESDLSKLNAADLIASVTPAEGSDQQAAQTERLTPEEIEARQRIWLPLLLTALIMFLVEAVVARRIRVARLVG
jgi:hypothetical protein